MTDKPRVKNKTVLADLSAIHGAMSDWHNSNANANGNPGLHKLRGDELADIGRVLGTARRLQSSNRGYDAVVHIQAAAERLHSLATDFGQADVTKAALKAARSLATK